MVAEGKFDETRQFVATQGCYAEPGRRGTQLKYIDSDSRPPKLEGQQTLASPLNVS
jgi:hypothetical protein